MIVWKIAYWLGMVAEIAIRAPFQKLARQAVKKERRVSSTEVVLLNILLVVMFVLPLVYCLTPWLRFADYSLPAWSGWLGMVFLVGSLLVFWRAHHDLRSNWSPSLEIYAEHSLVTEGIYRFIRHPMYASQWLWVIAQALLLQNWLAGPLNLVFFIFFYTLRVRAEEQMMEETFGEPYRAYMRATGRVLPRLG